jgi:hypothetical protein
MFVNVGRGTTGGYTDRVANAISSGASCTVSSDNPAARFAQGLGFAAAFVIPIGKVASIASRTAEGAGAGVRSFAESAKTIRATLFKGSQTVRQALSRSGTVDNVAAEATVVETERTAAVALKPGEATARWDEFLGEGPTTNIHPRTGLPDADRIVSADGTRSIRFGDHEMGSSATKFHFHEETWSFDPGANTWFVDNLIVRVPFPKGTW